MYKNFYLRKFRGPLYDAQDKSGASSGTGEQIPHSAPTFDDLLFQSTPPAGAVTTNWSIAKKGLSQRLCKPSS